eukprot:gnl/Chilomastix_cuspidata/1127.p1 GENE.gnl/Chilomastix_cuspidata/1127~~gnl/Chilomastix_cuspidata/1127.p1  ORF type:complete len:487 (+),score=157.50 gnl/Chilomastix_cuspidata/1127:140-1600(+)
MRPSRPISREALGVLFGHSFEGIRLDPVPIIVNEENWVPDNAHSACPICRKGFSVTKRRHHCRRCGRVFCSRCCPSSQSKLPPRTPRVCTLCAALLRTRGETPRSRLRSARSFQRLFSGRDPLLIANIFDLLAAAVLDTDVRESVLDEDGLLAQARRNVSHALKAALAPSARNPRFSSDYARAALPELLRAAMAFFGNLTVEPSVPLMDTLVEGDVHIYACLCMHDVLGVRTCEAALFFIRNFSREAAAAVLHTEHVKPYTLTSVPRVNIYEALNTMFTIGSRHAAENAAVTIANLIAPNPPAYAPGAMIYGVLLTLCEHVSQTREPFTRTAVAASRAVAALALGSIKAAERLLTKLIDSLATNLEDRDEGVRFAALMAVGAVLKGSREVILLENAPVVLALSFDAAIVAAQGLAPCLRLAAFPYLAMFACARHHVGGPHALEALDTPERMRFCVECAEDLEAEGKLPKEVASLRAVLEELRATHM